MTVYLSLWRGVIDTNNGLPAGTVSFPRMYDIVSDVASRHGLTAAHIIGPSRKKNIAWARHEAIWHIRQVKWLDGTRRYSLPQIGRFLGDRDHTSILNSQRRYQQYLDACVREAA